MKERCQKLEVISKTAAVETMEDSELTACTKQVAYVMVTLDNMNSTSSNQRNRGGKIKGMVQGIRDQAKTKEIVFIEIMVAIVIKIQLKGMGELEVTCSARGRDILIVCNSFKLQWGNSKQVSPPKQWSGKWTGRPKSTRKPITTNAKVIRKDIKLEKDPQYHKPDPLVRLIGDTIETNVRVVGVFCNRIVDSEVLISTISKSFAKALGLIHGSLDVLLDVEGRGGI